MSTFVRTIDDFIFDTFPAIQKIVSWIEYLTSASPQTLTRIIIITGSAGYCTLAYQLVLDGENKGWTLIAMQGIMVLGFLIQAQMLDNTTSSSTRNWLRANSYAMWLRLFFLVLLCITMLAILYGAPAWSILGLASVVVADYTLACDRLPPGNRFWNRFKETAHA